MKAQSAIIENLSHQVASTIKGTGNEKKFKEMFDMIANHSSLIHNVTKKLNGTIDHVNELAGVWSETTIKVNKELKQLEHESEENEEDMEKSVEKIVAKIKKLEEEVKTLRIALNNAKEESYGSKQGKIKFFSNKSPI